jgi:hypothetical protein
MSMASNLDTVAEWRKPFGPPPPPPLVQEQSTAFTKKSLRAKRKAMTRAIRQKVRLYARIFFSPHPAEEGATGFSVYGWTQQHKAGLMVLVFSLVGSAIYGLADFFQFFFYYFLALMYNPEAFFKPNTEEGPSAATAMAMSQDMNSFETESELTAPEQQQ